VLLLRTRGERRGSYRTNNSFDEIASSHCLPQGRDYADKDAITAGICDRRNGVQGQVCTAAIEGAHVRFGSKADMCNAKCHVRFTPDSDLNSGHRGVQLRAEHFSLCPIRSNVDLLRNGEGIIYVDAEIPHSALYFGMAKQKLNGRRFPVRR
jgi:hypothetical protein